MLFKKLNNLYKLKTRLYESLRMAKNSGADPEVISIRTNDLECDIAKVKKEINFEESMKPFVYMLVSFAIITLIILTITILKL